MDNSVYEELLGLLDQLYEGRTTLTVGEFEERVDAAYDGGNLSDDEYYFLLSQI